MVRDLNEVLEQARAIARDISAAHAAAVDRDARWPEESLRALQQAGLGGLVVPIAQGGLGQGLLAVARVCEILGQACSSTGLCFGMHCVGAAVIAAKATTYQEAQYLESIARGEHLTTLSLSEPGTGSQFWIPQAQLIAASPDTFRITGTKAFVTSGGHADSYVVSTTSNDPGAPPGTFSCVIVDRTAKGIAWGPEWQGFGMRGNSSRTMELNDVAVPRQNLLGEIGDEIWYVFEVIAPFFLVAMAGTYLGIASAAIDEVRRHLRRRTFSHTETLLAQQLIIQHRLGEIWAKVERSRQLLYHAAERGDKGGSDTIPLLLSAKAETTECVVEVTNEAMTLTGGSAYRAESPLPRLLRDARAAPVMAPTTDVLRTWVGRSLLDIPLLAE